MEIINWKIEGMSCANCALTINKYLEKKGMQHVKVNLMDGDVSFDFNGHINVDEIERGIHDLGYSVVKEAGGAAPQEKKHRSLYLRLLLVSAPFTLILLLHMTGLGRQVPILMNPWFQFLICLPVYSMGMWVFGSSALKSIRNGMPNMNVLIVLGSTAAFVYSLMGSLLRLGDAYLFYETAAAIITLIFLGNYVEELAMKSTQRQLHALSRSQKVMANMIAFDDKHQEQIFPVDNTALRMGDLILVRTGELVPADCKILWGEADVDESIITGESLPLQKKAKETLLGGSLMVDGTVRAQVTSEAKDSVLSRIVSLVRQAQGEKPPVQLLADRISAVFVPVVLGIALLTFMLNQVLLHQFTPSLMRAVAVLVIACPCAMGLATPAALAVGLGRAARNGILFRHAAGLELFREIREVIFDKTGTLTDGQFQISTWKKTSETITEEEFKRIAASMEKYSNHPVARCIYSAWKTKEEIRWARVNEIKGAGIRAATDAGDEYWAGSYKIAGKFLAEGDHNVYLVRNNELLGWVDVTDRLRPESKEVVGWLRGKGLRTAILSGDREDHCRKLGETLQVDEIFAEQSPEQKLEQVAYTSARWPTAMVGDGINDAPALAKATIGISMSEAAQLAMQTSDVVLMGKGLSHLPLALALGRHTYLTIRQNLFWAFFYNVLAIPAASFGLLTPGLAALAMAFSDVVLLINSIRLYVKKVL